MKLFILLKQAEQVQVIDVIGSGPAADQFELIENCMYHVNHFPVASIDFAALTPSSFVDSAMHRYDNFVIVAYHTLHISILPA